jgi:putative restriction endonuclease
LSIENKFGLYTDVALERTHECFDNLTYRAAFDAHLIGIVSDYHLHVSERLLGRNDGPMLESLKRLNGGTIHLPSRMKDRPDRDRLALRFERFKAAA